MFSGDKSQQLRSPMVSLLFSTSAYELKFTLTKLSISHCIDAEEFAYQQCFYA